MAYRSREEALGQAIGIGCGGCVVILAKLAMIGVLLACGLRYLGVI